jgi:hypothetical protein
MHVFELICYGAALLFALLAAFNVPARVNWIGLSLAAFALPLLAHAIDALNAASPSAPK